MSLVTCWRPGEFTRRLNLTWTSCPAIIFSCIRPSPSYWASCHGACSTLPGQRRPCPRPALRSEDDLLRSLDDRDTGVRRSELDYLVENQAARVRRRACGAVLLVPLRGVAHRWARAGEPRQLPLRVPLLPTLSCLSRSVLPLDARPVPDFYPDYPDHRVVA